MKIKNKISILLVDDHPLVREGLKSVLQTNKDFKLAGEALNGKEAIEKGIKLKPDIILLDISMPVMNGLEAARILKGEVPKSRIIALTMHDNISYARDMRKLGAKAYVLKDSPPEDLFSTIYNVMNDDTRFYFKSSEHTVSNIKELLRTENIILTKREKEILLYIANGYSNKEIGNLLFISSRTVESHRERMKRKLKIDNLADLIKYALNKSIIAPTS